MIVLLAKANVFNGTEDENRERFEALMKGGSHVAVRGVTKIIVNGKEDNSFFDDGDDATFMQGHNIVNLLAVYELLAEKQVLTPFVHMQLMKMLKDTWLHLGKTKTFFDKCAKAGELNQQLVDHYFEDPYVSVSLFMCLDKHDPEGIAFAYMLNRCNLEEKKAIRRFFDKQLSGGHTIINDKRNNWLFNHKTWMTVDVIKVMADNASLFEKNVVPIFLSHCNEFKLYDKENVEWLLPLILSDLFLLKKHGVPLSKPLFEMMLNNVFPGKAVDICCEAGYLEDFQDPDSQSQYGELFKRRDLINALAQLHHHCARCREAGVKIDNSDLCDDINNLFRAQSDSFMARVFGAAWQGSLFNKNPQESLQAVSRRLTEKYESLLNNKPKPQ